MGKEEKRKDWSLFLVPIAIKYKKHDIHANLTVFDFWFFIGSVVWVEQPCRNENLDIPFRRSRDCNSSAYELQPSKREGAKKVWSQGREIISSPTVVAEINARTTPRTVARGRTVKLFLLFLRKSSYALYSCRSATVHRAAFDVKNDDEANNK